MSLYCAPTIQTPSQEEVKELSTDLDLHIHDQHIPEYHRVISDILSKHYSVLDKYVEPTLPVKYPRTPGYRPNQEENKYNAWYYKTEIQGAPSGPLHGYKVAIKDSVPVAGVPMMNGSRVVEGYVPDYDATVVTRLLDAGATIVGKATCEDMCFCAGSFTPHPAPVLNPHDITKCAGGSSSGSAVVVQIGDADMAIGGDQAGSIRMPACWTGIVGLKPTYGLVPYTGIASLTPDLDHMGPMTRTVKDCALMLQVMAGDDGGLDMRQRNTPTQDQIPQYSQLLSEKLDGMRIGLLTEGFFECKPDVEKIVREAAHKLEERGAKVEDVSVPLHKDGVSIYYPSFLHGAYMSMIQSQGFSVGPPSFHATSYTDNMFACRSTRGRDLTEVVKMIEMLGKYVTDNYGMHFYSKSQNLLRLVRSAYDEAFQRYDVLVLPTIKWTAAKRPAADSSPQERMELAFSPVVNTAAFNGTGHPAMTINAGFSDGMPVGMMLVGKHMAEQTLFNVGYAFEQIRDGGKA